MATLATVLPPSGRAVSEPLRRNMVKFVRMAKEWGERRVVFCGHTLSDADYLGTAYPLSFLFKNPFISFQGPPHRSALPLMAELGLPTGELLVNIQKLDKRFPLILCDVRSKYLTRLVGSRNIVAMVDHHKPGTDDHESDIEVIDPAAPAASLLAYELLRIANFEINSGSVAHKRIALALAVGMICDDMGMITRSWDERIPGLDLLYERCGWPKVHVVKVLSNICGKSLKELVALAFPPLTAADKEILEKAVKDISLITLESQRCKGRGLNHVVCAITSAENGMAAVTADMLISNKYAEKRHKAGEPVIDVSVVFYNGNNMGSDHSDIEYKASIRVTERIAKCGITADLIGCEIGLAAGAPPGGGHELKGGVTFTAKPRMVAYLIEQGLIRSIVEARSVK